MKKVALAVAGFIGSAFASVSALAQTTVAVSAGNVFYSFDTAALLTNITNAGGIIIGIAVIVMGIRWLLSVFV